MSPEQKAEEIRRAVLRYLAARQTARFTADAIAAGIRDDGHAHTPELLTAALAFLTRDGWLESTFPPAGSTARYQITPKGILAHERGEF